MQQQTVNIVILDKNRVRKGEIEVSMPTRPSWPYQQPRADLGTTDESISAVKKFCEDNGLNFADVKWITY